MRCNIMNPTNLVAFLYAIGAENIEDSALKNLGTLLKYKNIDWESVQEKLDDILSRHPTLEDTYNNYQTQLDSKQSFLDLFLAIPEELKLNKAPLTRSGMPGLPDKETTELTNIAVLILQSDNPSEKSNELLKPTNEIVKKLGNNEPC